MRRVSETKGLFLLRSWLERNGWTSTAFAEAVGVSRPAVVQWRIGTSRPTASFREVICRLTGIPADAWYTANEAARVHSGSMTPRRKRAKGASVQSARVQRGAA